MILLCYYFLFVSALLQKLQKLLLYCITRSLKVLHRVAWHDSNPWLCIRSYLMMTHYWRQGLWNIQVIACIRKSVGGGLWVFLIKAFYWSAKTKKEQSQDKKIDLMKLYSFLNLSKEHNPHICVSRQQQILEAATQIHPATRYRCSLPPATCAV